MMLLNGREEHKRPSTDYLSSASNANVIADTSENQ